MGLGSFIHDSVVGAFLHDWFGWPNGSVLTNLVASLIWGGFAFHKLRQIHKSHKHLHAKLDKLGASSRER